MLRSIPAQEEDKSVINHFIEFLSQPTSKVPYICRADKEKVDSLIQKYWNSITQKQSTSISGQNSSKIQLNGSLMDESQTEYISVSLPKEMWKALLKLETEALDSSIQSAIHAIRGAISKISTKTDMPVKKFLDEVENAMEEPIPHRDTWVTAFTKYNRGRNSIPLNPDGILSSFFTETIKITRQLNKENSVSEVAVQAGKIEQWLLRNVPSLDKEED